MCIRDRCIYVRLIMSGYLFFCIYFNAWYITCHPKWEEALEFTYKVIGEVLALSFVRGRADMSGTRYQVCLYEISHRISVCGKFAKLRTFPPSLTLHRRTLELRVVGIEICCTPSFTEEYYAELKDLSMSRLHAQERIITSCVDLAPTLLNAVSYTHLTLPTILLV